jgi:hypothetical protein
MDIVYPLGTGSLAKNLELRMSLRSVEKYLSGYDRIYIVGECPDWAQNVIHIPFVEQSAISDFNIMQKVSKVCQMPEVSEDFLFMNDDHYLLTKFEAKEFPYYYMGTLEDHYRTRPDSYGRRARASMNYLKERGLPTKHFDIHYPIIYNKSLFLKHVTNGPDWEREKFIIKSLYANGLQIEGEPAQDFKKNVLPTEGAKVFSSQPHIRPNVQRFLVEQFPKMCSFEKTGLYRNEINGSSQRQSILEVTK